MYLMLGQFLWGHSSRVCDISCFFLEDEDQTETEVTKTEITEGELSRVEFEDLVKEQEEVCDL